MVFKIVVSDPKSRKAYQKEVGEGASGLIGKRIGEKVSGSFLGLEGYELEITGGSDRDGFPMRHDVEGQARKRIVLAFPPGFHPFRKGERKRKGVRGNTVSKETSQINLKVVKTGKKPLETLFGVKEKPKEAPKGGAKPEGEKPGERPKEAPREEVKPEEKMGVKTLEERERGVAKEEEKGPAEKPTAKTKQGLPREQGSPVTNISNQSEGKKSEGKK